MAEYLRIQPCTKFATTTVVRLEPRDINQKQVVTELRATTVRGASFDKVVEAVCDRNVETVAEIRPPY
jgi:hypothetical protein